jgi:hypothetical protein
MANFLERIRLELKNELGCQVDELELKIYQSNSSGSVPANFLLATTRGYHLDEEDQDEYDGESGYYCHHRPLQVLTYDNFFTYRLYFFDDDKIKLIDITTVPALDDDDNKINFDKLLKKNSSGCKFKISKKEDPKLYCSRMRGLLCNTGHHSTMCARGFVSDASRNKKYGHLYYKIDSKLFFFFFEFNLVGEPKLLSSSIKRLDEGDSFKLKDCDVGHTINFCDLQAKWDKRTPDSLDFYCTFDPRKKSIRRFEFSKLNSILDSSLGPILGNLYSGPLSIILDYFIELPDISYF